MLSRKINIDHVAHLMRDQRVLCRVDFNVPVKEGKVTDPTRIKATIPTLRKILEQNPKNLVLMSHLGRPDGERNEKYSMRPVLDDLQQLLGREGTFFLRKIDQNIKKNLFGGKCRRKNQSI